jgi:hypothetical protein
MKQLKKYVYQLVRKEKDRLQAKFAVTKVEEVLERGPKEVKDHGIIVALGAIPPDKGNAHATCEGLVHLGLVFELGMLGFDGLELDSDFFTGNNINSEVDITWGEGRGVSERERREDRKGSCAPKDPEPIFLPSLYLPPTRRSSL